MSNILISCYSKYGSGSIHHRDGSGDCACGITIRVRVIIIQHIGTWSITIHAFAGCDNSISIDMIAPGGIGVQVHKSSFVSNILISCYSKYGSGSIHHRDGSGDCACGITIRVRVIIIQHIGTWSITIHAFAGCDNSISIDMIAPGGIGVQVHKSSFVSNILISCYSKYGSGSIHHRDGSGDCACGITIRVRVIIIQHIGT